MERHYVFKESPGDDRSALFESAKKPGVNPLSGSSSSGQDASTSSAPPAKAMPVLRQRQNRLLGRQPVQEGLQASPMSKAKVKRLRRPADYSHKGNFRLRNQ